MTKSYDDLWKHKHKTMTCKYCMYFCNYRCRRHAPTMSGWVAVFEEDWCGDHKLDKSDMCKIETIKEKNGTNKEC